MIEPWRYARPFPLSTQLSACFFVAALSLGTVLVHPTIGFAQSGAVTVDLSVIQDGGVSAFGPTSISGLLVPPRANPVSQLHVAPARMPKLNAPMAKTNPAPMTDSPVVAKATPVMPTPKPMPAPKVVKAEMAPAPKSILPEVPKQMPKAAPAATEKPVVDKMAKTKAMPAKASDAPPPPPVVAAAAEPAAPDQQASTGPQAANIAPGQAMRIEFAEAETKLPDAMKDTLRKIADGVHDKKDLRLQLMAYAGAEGLSASKARRLSLSRALSVRSFLIESGVRSTRIDVRALGNKTSDKPANRVDVNIAKR